MASRPKKIRVFQTDSIDYHFQKSDPPSLVVAVSGMVTTTGWSEAELRPIEAELSPDRVFDLEFVATPPAPGAITLPMLRPVSAEFVIEKDAELVIALKIHDRQGAITHVIGQTQLAESSGAALAAAGLEAAAAGRSPTTHVVGEEFTTLRVGEEHGGSTLRLGEEFPPPPTAHVGEDWKTLRFGEENIGTTFRIGEEVRSLPWHPSENPKGFVGETSPAVDDPKPPLGEDIGPIDDFLPSPRPFGSWRRGG